MLTVPKEVIVRIAGGAFQNSGAGDSSMLRNLDSADVGGKTGSLILCVHREILLQALGDCAG